MKRMWALKSYVLAVEKFPGKHSGERIAASISEIFKKWNIDSNKVHFFVRDGASNMKRAFEVYIHIYIYIYI
jgi:hypothetical protein